MKKTWGFGANFEHHLNIHGFLTFFEMPRNEAAFYLNYNICKPYHGKLQGFIQTNLKFEKFCNRRKESMFPTRFQSNFPFGAEAFPYSFKMRQGSFG